MQLSCCFMSSMSMQSSALEIHLPSAQVTPKVTFGKENNQNKIISIVSFLLFPYVSYDPVHFRFWNRFIKKNKNTVNQTIVLVFLSCGRQELLEISWNKAAFRGNLSSGSPLRFGYFTKGLSQHQTFLFLVWFSFCALTLKVVSIRCPWILILSSVLLLSCVFPTVNFYGFSSFHFRFTDISS